MEDKKECSFIDMNTILKEEIPSPVLHNYLTSQEQRLLNTIRAHKRKLLEEIIELQNQIHSYKSSNAKKGGENLKNNDEGAGSSSSSGTAGTATTSNKSTLSYGLKKFNMDPKKGIEYLIENGFIDNTVESVASLLYKGEGLNKTAIGDYLGEKNPFNEQVLKKFLQLHDFKALILVQALRQFLWSFRLPGEAQKIDRMMECFAYRYCEQNPNIFTNTDTCYILAFAIIMLNTSLHNPSVKEKPSVDDFIRMNRGIDNGGDLPKELLASFYNSILSEPFKIPQDDGDDLIITFFNPDKEGWLWKQGGRVRSWKRRWFILKDRCLYYFEYTTDKEPRGIIPLEDSIRVRFVEDKSRDHCFEIFIHSPNSSGNNDENQQQPQQFIKACKTDAYGRVVQGKHSVYRMSAPSAQLAQQWVNAIQGAVS